MEFKWINVNDRMPDEHQITPDDTDVISDDVLVTYKFLDGSTMVEVARTYNHQWIHRDNWLCCPPEVIAWMEKPTPYDLLKNYLLEKWVACKTDLPPVDVEVIVSDGTHMWTDTLLNDVVGDDTMYYWDTANIDIYETAWQPMPKVWDKEE